MIKWIWAAPKALFLAGLGYVIMVSVASLEQGYAWSEMDWDQKSHTTLRDFLAASDIGKPNVDIDGKRWTQNFAYKDGLPVKTACP